MSKDLIPSDLREIVRLIVSDQDFAAKLDELDRKASSAAFTIARAAADMAALDAAKADHEKALAASTAAHRKELAELTAQQLREHAERMLESDRAAARVEGVRIKLETQQRKLERRSADVEARAVYLGERLRVGAQA